jgi:hypothetical protein
MERGYRSGDGFGDENGGFWSRGDLSQKLASLMPRVQSSTVTEIPYRVAADYAFGSIRPTGCFIPKFGTRRENALLTFLAGKFSASANSARYSPANTDKPVFAFNAQKYESIQDILSL